MNRDLFNLLLGFVCGQAIIILAFKLGVLTVLLGGS